MGLLVGCHYQFVCSGSFFFSFWSRQADSATADTIRERWGWSTVCTEHARHGICLAVQTLSTSTDRISDKHKPPKQMKWVLTQPATCWLLLWLHVVKLVTATALHLEASVRLLAPILTIQHSITESKTINYILFIIFY